MWIYERRLQYPVYIRHPDKKLADYIIESLNKAPFETKASCQYISHRYRTHYREISGLLTDIGTEVSVVHSNAQNIYRKRENIRNL
ncbi:MAG TPA: manganese containing catalase [Lachnospiraceae bacterium]|uniref:manganese catalase family protein n=1 Tax=Anaerosporobacter sp. TaxID=1872529 RepID=UPI000EE1437F|nr:manganese catalase family protein [Anaerosporobacter sp.]HAB60418.1 manganese containing catalase [Lachnospiraceae bacterium]